MKTIRQTNLHIGERIELPSNADLASAGIIGSSDGTAAESQVEGGGLQSLQTQLVVSKSTQLVRVNGCKCSQCSRLQV
jgi:hypothetical protein